MRNIAMETAKWPVGDARHQPVFHRVVMDVINVSLEIDLVANGVLPITALPDAFFPLCDFADGARFGGWKATRET